MNTHWNPHRKASVLDAIARGTITRRHAIECHNISDEEMTGWEGRYNQGGIKGLRVTRTNDSDRVHKNILKRRCEIQIELKQIDKFLSLCRRYAAKKYSVTQ